MIKAIPGIQANMRVTFEYAAEVTTFEAGWVGKIIYGMQNLTMDFWTDNTRTTGIEIVDDVLKHRFD